MSSRKRQVFDQLIDEVRRSQNATDRFDQAVADALGVHRTDMRCIDLLEREGPLPAGRLAERMGLTSGAMTAALDRLEAAGYAQRHPDPGDRRRVLVELTPSVLERGHSFYSAHVRRSEEVYGRYDTRQLELLLEFVRAGREFNEEQALALEQRNRERSRR